MKEIVINACFGGFGLSEAAYKKLIEWGVPVRKYIDPKRNPETMLYEKEPLNEGEIIFDRTLDSKHDRLSKTMIQLDGPYWETWLNKNRTHPLLLRVIKELKEKANGKHAKLKIVSIPDDVEWEIDEYDGAETIREKHRQWS